MLRQSRRVSGRARVWEIKCILEKGESPYLAVHTMTQASALMAIIVSPTYISTSIDTYYENNKVSRIDYCVWCSMGGAPDTYLDYAQAMQDRLANLVREVRRELRAFRAADEQLELTTRRKARKSS